MSSSSHNVIPAAPMEQSQDGYLTLEGNLCDFQVKQRFSCSGKKPNKRRVLRLLIITGAIRDEMR